MKLPFILAKRFVAGETFAQSAPKIVRLNDAGIAVTLDLLGENVSDRSLALDTIDNYITLIRQIGERGLNASISVKLTMMGLDIDTGFCTENLFRLLEAAREHSMFVRIDMEGSAYTESTLQLFRKAHEEFGPKHVGVVLQAYLHRTRDDVRALAAVGADIRLCKGAYKEPARIALQRMDEIREVYKEYAAVLFDAVADASGAVGTAGAVGAADAEGSADASGAAGSSIACPRMATHDDALIEWVKDTIMDRGIRKDSFEFQMLYGLRQDTMEQLASDGYQTRVYVPYGTMWFPYYKRRLTERKENLFFVLNTLFKK
ncbi:MAG: proline dehydrogenase [Bacteroidetes bacterium]|nr:MAG: proline dehydrogenase [Bacteroidota bacterium]